MAMFELDGSKAKKPRGQDNWEKVNRDLAGIIAVSLISVVALAIGLAVARYDASHVISVVGMALAAFAVAFVIGFLFGYPRMRQPSPNESRTATGEHERDLYEDNTALAQISDWLTKILLGVGLIQFGSFSSGLTTFCKDFAESSGRPGAFFVALSVTLSYAASGALCGVLWTRLRLQSGLNDGASRRLSHIQEQVDELSRQRQHDAMAIGMVEKTLVTKDTDTKELIEVLDAVSDSTFAKILELVFAYRRNNWAVPGESRRKVERAAEVLEALTQTTRGQKAHQVWGQYGYALKDKEPEDWEKAVPVLTRAIELRGDAKTMGFHMYEYNRAICRIATSSATTGEPKSADGEARAVLADLCVAVMDHRSRSILANTKVFQIDPWLAANKLNFFRDVDFVEMTLAGIDRTVTIQHATLEVLALACRIKPADEERVSTLHIIWAMTAYLDRPSADRDLSDEDIGLRNLFCKYARTGAMVPKPFRVRYEPGNHIPQGQLFSACVRRALQQPSDSSLMKHSLGLTEIFYHLARMSTGDTFREIRANLARTITGGDASPEDFKTVFCAAFEEDIDRLGLDVFIPQDVRKMILAASSPSNPKE